MVLKPLQRLLQDVNTVPQGHEGGPEEEAKGASELGDKRRPWVDQRLPLDKDDGGHCVEAEKEVFYFHDCIFAVLALLSGLSLALNKEGCD